MKFGVIDDDPQNLKLVRFMLAQEQLEIHTASNAQRGLEGLSAPGAAVI